MTENKFNRMQQIVVATVCSFVLTAGIPGCDSTAPFVPMAETHTRQELADGTLVHDHSTEYGLPDGTSDRAKSRTVTKVVRGNRSWDTEAEYRGETLKLVQDERDGTLVMEYAGHKESLEQLASGHFRYRGETYPDNDDGRMRVGKSMADSTMSRRIPAGALWEGVRGLAIAQETDGHRLEMVITIATAVIAFCEVLKGYQDYQSFEHNPVESLNYENSPMDPDNQPNMPGF